VAAGVGGQGVTLTEKKGVVFYFFYFVTFRRRAPQAKARIRGRQIAAARG
jgi:hypothetical protein